MTKHRNPTGIDYGVWTELPAIAEDTPIPVDFAIIGGSSGPRTNDSFTINKDLDHPRKMFYGFYHTYPSWEEMAENWLENAFAMDAKFIWLDWERNILRSPLQLRPGHNASRAYRMIRMMGAEFNDQVGIYSNFNDYNYFKNFIPDHAEIPWWLAWPDENLEYNSPKFYEYWELTGREDGNYQFEQYAWKLPAAPFGVTNNKKAMDGNRFMGTLAELDAFLKITDPPPPPPGGCTEEERKRIKNQALHDAAGAVLALKE
jgi:hypothetical protein